VCILAQSHFLDELLIRINELNITFDLSSKKLCTVIVCQLKLLLNLVYKYCTSLDPVFGKCLCWFSILVRRIRINRMKVDMETVANISAFPLMDI